MSAGLWVVVGGEATLAVFCICAALVFMFSWAKGPGALTRTIQRMQATQETLDNQTSEALTELAETVSALDQAVSYARQSDAR